DVAGQDLALAAVDAVPDALRGALRHRGAEEGVVDVDVQVERQAGVSRHRRRSSGAGASSA
ncbi:MAG: hypothetical protein ACK559_06545, partial [bacterium]